MSALPRAGAAGTGSAWARRLARAMRRPGWWVVPVAALGWGYVAASALTAGGAHPAHASADPAGPALTMVAPTLAMIAVMIAFVGWNLGEVALRLPSAARRGTTVLIAAGWASVWLVALVVFHLLGGLLVTLLGPVWALVAVTAAGLWWLVLPYRSRSLARCHRTVAPPLQPGRARAACLRYGRRLGISCVTSCGALMLPMPVLGHPWWGIVVVMAALSYERTRTPYHPALVVPILALLAVSATAIALG